ncbi:MAG: hypothetical protein ACREFV_10960 [Acetobacteraceae bacterium]
MDCYGAEADSYPSVELLREIACQGEARLDAALNLATSAELRATTLCGIFGTWAVTLEAAILTYLPSSHDHFALILAGAVAGGGFFIAAIVAGISGAPRHFHVAGGAPDELRTWSWTGANWRTADELLDATGQRYAQSIRTNEKTHRHGSRMIWISLAIGCTSPIIGGILYFTHANLFR